MLRKWIFSFLCLCLGGVVLASNPPQKKTLPVIINNCSTPAQIKPILLAQINAAKPGQIDLKSPPKVTEFKSSGPLVPVPLSPASVPPISPPPVTESPGAVPPAALPPVASPANPPEAIPPKPGSPKPAPLQENGKEIKLPNPTGEPPIPTGPAPLSVPDKLYPQDSKQPGETTSPPIDLLIKPAQNKEVVPLPPVNDPPKTEAPKPATPYTPVPPITEAPKPASPMEFTPPAGANVSPWVIRVEMVKTMTHLVASSKDAEFKVICENLKVQSPTGDIQAEGQVKVFAAGMDMHCERLTITWKNDWVIMEGKVRLQAKKNTQVMELEGEKLQLKLTTLTSTGALKTITPLLHKSAYFPPQGASDRPTPQVNPATPYPYYKRVTK